MNDTPPAAPTNEELSHAKDGRLTCGDCIYCEIGPGTKKDIFSRVCHRMPPIPVLAQTPDGPGVITIRPMIRTDTWACGEFLGEEDGL